MLMILRMPWMIQSDLCNGLLLCNVERRQQLELYNMDYMDHMDHLQPVAFHNNITLENSLCYNPGLYHLETT